MTKSTPATARTTHIPIGKSHRTTGHRRACSATSGFHHTGARRAFEVAPGSRVCYRVAMGNYIAPVHQGIQRGVTIRVSVMVK